MNSTIPADLLELKDNFETWRTNRKYVRETILRSTPLGGESEQRFFAFFKLRFRKHTPDPPFRADPRRRRRRKGSSAIRRLRD